MNLKKIIHNKIVKNASWIILGRIIQMVMSLFIGVLSARYLGPSNYGVINYASAYTTFFLSFCTLGINSVIVKELVENREQEGTILGTTLVLRGISSFISAALIIAIVSVVDRDSPETIAVVALSSIALIFNIFETLNYWFQSRLESKATAIATLIGYTITAVYRIVLLVTQKSVVFFAFATSVDYISVGVILLLLYKEKGGIPFRFSLDYGKALLHKSYHFILPSLMVAIYGQTDKIMLKQIISDAEIGYYSTALTICNMWVFLLTAIIDSMYPSIVEAYNVNQKKFIFQNKLLYAIVFYISAFVSLVIVAFAPLIVKILYGAAYAQSVAPLRIITWYTAFSYIGVARNAWIVCENKQKYIKYMYLSAALSNVLLNFLLIPPLGASGAAIASLAAQVITTLIAPFFIKDMRENAWMIVDAILLRGLLWDK